MIEYETNQTFHSPGSGAGALDGPGRLRGRGPSTPAESAPPVSSVPSEPAPTPEVQTPAPTDAPAPEDDGFEDILDGMLGFGPGTAGSSLSSAGQAAALLNWCAAHPDADTEALSGRVTAWLDGLADFEKENIAESWPMVLGSARYILEDPEAAAPLLEDAGAELDPAQPDSESFEAVAGVLNDTCPLPRTRKPRSDSAKGPM